MNHFVILAGGSGQRLWPLSTKKRPKHLIPFLENKSLLEQTIERINSSRTDKKIWILTNQEQLQLVKQHVNHLNVNVIAEPVARNTAPAILWICNQIRANDYNATVIILPADHFIPDKTIFNQTIEYAIKFAQDNPKIVTLGITPSSAATGYGYIQANMIASSNIYPNVHPVVKFHEKPDIQAALQYVKQTDMFWNAGIFVGTASTFLNEFESCSKKLFDAMQHFMRDKMDYADIENISVDYAVMEKSFNICLIPANFEWYDVGNLAVFLSLKKRFEKTTESIITIEGHNNLANTTKKLVVCVGVSDLCIIETADVILIAKNGCTENVKAALTEVKKSHESTL